MPAIIEVFKIDHANKLFLHRRVSLAENDDQKFDTLESILTQNLDASPYPYQLHSFSVRDVYSVANIEIRSEYFWFENPRVPQDDGEVFEEGNMVRFNGETDIEIVDGMAVRFLPTSLIPGASLVQVRYCKVVR